MTKGKGKEKEKEKERDGSNSNSDNEVPYKIVGEGDADADADADSDSETALNWIRTSDSRVEYVSWEAVRRETSGVFMLFYERVVPGAPSNSNHAYTSSAMGASVSSLGSLAGSWFNGVAGSSTAFGPTGLERDRADNLMALALMTNGNGNGLAITIATALGKR